MGDFEEIPLELPAFNGSGVREPELQMMDPIPVPIAVSMGDNHTNTCINDEENRAVALAPHSGRAYAAETTWQTTITGASKLPLHTGTVVVYTVETLIDGKTHIVSHRYSRFEQLDAAVREFYRSHHQQFLSNLPPLASKAWAWKDQFSREFISARRDALQEYMDRVLGLPHATECPALREFLFSDSNQ